jgi:uncharacterized protein (TIGR02594 family)
MSHLPPRFAFLEKEPGPRMLREALALYATTEKPGSASNPVIMGWAKEVGLEKAYSNDGVPWCGLFAAVIAKRSDKKIPKDPLWALNWNNFGTKVDRPMLGDLIVLRRDGGGHVTLYVAEDEDYYYGLGGNQSDKVTIAPIAKARKPSFRRPTYINQPANVRPIVLSPTGEQVAQKES